MQADEPTEAEQQAIAGMTAAHPTWTAQRHRGGWSICEGEVPVLAWDPDVSAAVQAAERAIRPDDAEALASLREDWQHAYTVGHDSDGVWWAVRKDASIAPLESGTAEGLRRLLAIDDQAVK